MWMLVGLGNPGGQYAFTRHNIGFMAIDFLLKSIGAPKESSDHKAHISQFKWDDQKILTVKPQTFMNRSGESVQSLMHFYKIPIDHVIVIHDDIDQAYGSIKLQKNRGHGGHNGIRDISEKLSSADYIRLKIGVGRPPHPQMAVADYVLSAFNPEEMAMMNEYLTTCLHALESVIFNGLAKASTQFNGPVFKK